MSSTVRTSLRRARSSARLLMRSTCVGREMRPGDEERAALRDESFLDVRFGDRHVGAVLAQEDERERVLVLDAQNDRAGERAGIGATWLTSQPSLRIVSSRKPPSASSPTREISARLRPRRAQPNAVLADEPPRYFAKLVTSSRRAPICCA
jgi:hypothetical protein